MLESSRRAAFVIPYYDPYSKDYDPYSKGSKIRALNLWKEPSWPMCQMLEAGGRGSGLLCVSVGMCVCVCM